MVPTQGHRFVMFDQQVSLCVNKLLSFSEEGRLYSDKCPLYWGPSHIGVLRVFVVL